MPVIMKLPATFFSDYQQAKDANDHEKAEGLKNQLLNNPPDFYTLFMIDEIFPGIRSEDESEIVLQLFRKYIDIDPTPNNIDPMLNSWIVDAFEENNPLKRELITKLFSFTHVERFNEQKVDAVGAALFAFRDDEAKVGEVLESKAAVPYLKKTFPNKTAQDKEEIIAELRKLNELIDRLDNEDLSPQHPLNLPHISKAVLLCKVCKARRPAAVRVILEMYTNELSQSDLDEALALCVANHDGDFSCAAILYEKGARLHLDALQRQMPGKNYLEIVDKVMPMIIDKQSADICAQAMYDSGGYKLVEEYSVESEPRQSLIAGLLVNAPNAVKVGLIQVNSQSDKLESLIVIPGFVDLSLMIDLYQWANYSEFGMLKKSHDEREMQNFIEEKFESNPAFAHYRRIQIASQWMQNGEHSVEKLAEFRAQGITDDELLRIAVTGNNAAVADYLIGQAPSNPTVLVALREVGPNIKRPMIDVCLKHNIRLAYTSNYDWDHSVLVEIYRSERHMESPDLTLVKFLLGIKSDIAINVARSSVDVHPMHYRPATLLDLAVTDKNYDLIDAILARDDVDVNLPKENPPLVTAIQNRMWKTVEKLYLRGARLTKAQMEKLQTHNDYLHLKQLVSNARISRLAGLEETEESLAKKWDEIVSKNGNFSEQNVNNILSEIDEENNNDAELFYKFLAKQYTRSILGRMNEVGNRRKSFLKGLLETLPNNKKGELLQTIEFTKLSELLSNPLFADNRLIGHLYIQQKRALLTDYNNGVIIKALLGEKDYYQKLIQAEELLAPPFDADKSASLKQSGVSVEHLLTLAMLNKNTQAIDYILEEFDWRLEDAQAALEVANGDIDKEIIRIYNKHEVPLYHANSSVVLDVYAHQRSMQPPDLSLVYYVLSLEGDIGVNRSNDSLMDSPESIIKANLLELAVNDGNFELVDRILERDDVDVSLGDNRPLVSAVNSGNWALAEKLFAKGGRLTPEQARQVSLNGPEWVQKINKHRLLRYQKSSLVDKSADDLIAYIATSNGSALDLFKSIHCQADEELFKKVMKKAAENADSLVYALSDKMGKALEEPSLVKRRLLAEIWGYFSEYYQEDAYSSLHTDGILHNPVRVQELIHLPGLTETRVKDLLIYLSNAPAENAGAQESARILRSTKFFTPKIQSTLELRKILQQRDLSSKEIQQFSTREFFLNEVLDTATKYNRARAIEFVLVKVKEQANAQPEIVTNAHRSLVEAISEVSVATLRSFIFAKIPMVAPQGPQGASKKVPLVLQAYLVMRMDLVETLLKSNVAIDINYFNNPLPHLGQKKGTLLTMAIEDENMIVFDWLLAHNDIDVKLADNLAIVTALEKGRFDLAERLYQKGARIPVSGADALYARAMETQTDELLTFLSNHECPAPSELVAVCGASVEAGNFDRFKQHFAQSGDPALRSVLFIGAFGANDVETMRVNHVGVSETALKEMVEAGIENENYEAVEYLLNANKGVELDLESYITFDDEDDDSQHYDTKVAQLFMKVKHLRQKVFKVLAKLDSTYLTDEILNDIQEGTIKLTPQELQQGLHKLVLVAVKNNDLIRVVELLNRGAKLRYNNSEALKVAASADVPNHEILQLLLERGHCDPADCCYMLPFEVLEKFRIRYDEDDDELYENDLVQLAENLISLCPSTLTDADKNTIREQCIGLGASVTPARTFKLIEDSMHDKIYAALPPGEQEAFKMLRKSREIAIYSDEYAGEKALVARSDDMFNRVVRPTHQSTFDAYPGENKKEKIRAIEKEIRAFILDSMLQSCSSSPDRNSPKIVALINAHRQTLIDQSDENIMAQMRALAVSNTDNAQIAWRAYDPAAPLDSAWKNLLSKSWDIRERVAYYFIAKPSIRRRNFLQQLADIRRAHNEQGQPLDSHSCDPGTRTRIARMGDGHSVLQLPPDRREILQKVVAALVMEVFTKFTRAFGASDLANTFYGLTTLSLLGAEDIIRGKGFFEDSLMPYRQRFMAAIGSQADVEAKVIEAWRAELTQVESQNDYVIRPTDRLLIELELLNIGGGPKGKQVNDRYHKMVKNPYDVTPVNIDPKQYKPERFRELSQAMSANVQKYIEFEMVYNACLDVNLPQVVLHALIVKWIDSSFQEPTKRKQLLHDVLKNTALTVEQQQNLFNIIEKNSIFTSLNEEKVARIREIAEEKVKSTAPDKGMFNGLVDKIVEGALRESTMETRKKIENR